MWRITSTVIVDILRCIFTTLTCWSFRTYLCLVTRKKLTIRPSRCRAVSLVAGFKETRVRQVVAYLLISRTVEDLQ